MSIIKSFSSGSGDTFYIDHNSSNFTVIDCNLLKETKEKIMDEICEKCKNKKITRFICTHPDEDHFRGIEYFDERQEIINFYCVENKVKKEDETTSFKKYCELRDGAKAFYIKKGCSRKWMNESGDNDEGVHIDSSGIDILWPDVDNDKFKEMLEKVNNGEEPNNISPIIKYSLENGIRVLWFGDLEHEFMDTIKNDFTLPNADVIFAPHHGRYSGEIPEKWLKDISPQVIILGEAPSEYLRYFNNYNTITQNSAGDITLLCESGKVHFYCSESTYEKRDYLIDEKRYDKELGYYIGSLETREGA